MPIPPVANPAVIHLSDLPARAGEVLGHSEWRTITQDDVDTFARLTGDEQWIHIDDVRAKAGPFGGTIVYGYLTLSLSTLFLDEVVTVEGAGLVLNYGSNRVRYPSPVPVGSNVRAEITLASVEHITGGLQTTFHLLFEVEGQAKPGCVADIVYRYYEEFPS
jgi:acyl dehydratase